MKGSHLPVLKKTRKSDEDIFEPRYNKVYEIWDVELQRALITLRTTERRKGEGASEH